MYSWYGEKHIHVSVIFLKLLLLASYLLKISLNLIREKYFIQYFCVCIVFWYHLNFKKNSYPKKLMWNNKLTILLSATMGWTSITLNTFVNHSSKIWKKSLKAWSPYGRGHEVTRRLWVELEFWLNFSIAVLCIRVSVRVLMLNTLKDKRCRGVGV